MNIYEALKLIDKDIRISCGPYRWMVWDDNISRWVVWQKKPYERRAGCLYHGDSADEAVSVLVAEDNA
jgi:hypothetical protein